MRHISEREYTDDLQRQLKRLARSIAASGLSLSEIAKATRMKWDTVYAARKGRPIRMENAQRIRYFLKVYKSNKDEEIH